MGYTHYWKRKQEIDLAIMTAIVADFRKVLPEIQKHVDLADGMGEGEPIIKNDCVCFNGKHNCGHPVNHEIVIPWPSDEAGGVANPFVEKTVSDTWYAGAVIDKRCCGGSCDYETFDFPRVLELEKWQKPEQGKYFQCCKTAFRPYDLAVIVFLIIAKQYLKDQLVVNSDGRQQHWFDGQMMCHTVLGYGLGFKLSVEGKEVKA